MLQEIKKELPVLLSLKVVELAEGQVKTVGTAEVDDWIAAEDVEELDEVDEWVDGADDCAVD